jgi:hypothetical protein
MQEATGEEHGPEPTQKGPGLVGPVGSAQGLFGPVHDALCPRCSSIYCLRRRRPPHRTNHSTDAIHQKTAAARWGRELDELIARINAGGEKEARGGLQDTSLGVFPSFIAAIFIDDILRSLHHPYVLQSL